MYSFVRSLNPILEYNILSFYFTILILHQNLTNILYKFKYTLYIRFTGTLYIWHFVYAFDD